LIHRIKRQAKVLICCTTNKAIDALVAKFEQVGMRDMLAVGSAERMGDATKRFLMSARLDMEEGTAAATALADEATAEREACEVVVEEAQKALRRAKKGKGKPAAEKDEEVEEEEEEEELTPLKMERKCLKKLTKKLEHEPTADELAKYVAKKIKKAEKESEEARAAKKAEAKAHRATAESSEDNRGFVARQLDKLRKEKNLKGDAKRTPGVVRLMENIGYKGPKCSYGELIALSTCYLESAPKEADGVAYHALAEAKKRLKAITQQEQKLRESAAKARLKARYRLWRRARVVACTAATAAHVSQRVAQAMEEDEEEQEISSAGDRAGAGPAHFECVVLDEAGAMLEVDAVGYIITIYGRITLGSTPHSG